MINLRGKNYDHPLDLEVFHVQLFRQTHIILNLFITLGWVIFFRHSIFPQPVNGHFRNLNWRHLPYVRPNFQGIYPQFIWPEIWYQKYTSILGSWRSPIEPAVDFQGAPGVPVLGTAMGAPSLAPEELSDAGGATSPRPSPCL